MALQDVPGLDLEEALWAEGVRTVAGVDEVGRGAWAGPLVAAAVVLPPDLRRCAPLVGVVRDSKVLTASEREVASRLVRQVALAAAWAWAWPAEIDALGLAAANRLAFRRAVGALAIPAEFLLLDYFALPEALLPQQPVMDGDARSLSIAAASVVAKVARDHFMRVLDWLYPGYGLAQHKGYGTADHRRALERRGPCGLHRRSFAPVAASLSRDEGQDAPRA